METCCRKEDTRSDPILPQKDKQLPNGCGYRNSDGIGFRITGDKDNESQFGEFPWMVAILREESNGRNLKNLSVYQCGGALIHPSAVLTAAHCVTDENKNFKVRAGEWDTQHLKELYPHQDREVNSITIHPHYYAGALYNDIAMLFLKTPFESAENVGMACLPKENLLTVNSRCFATGWGKNVFGRKGKYQVILKKISLPVVENDKCEKSLRTTRLGKLFKLNDSFMCAGGEPEKDTCTGDGGSPLVCPIPGQKERFYQAGIVSWGIDCGKYDIPGVYTNVAVFRDWIDKEMRSQNLNIRSYQY